MAWTKIGTVYWKNKKNMNHIYLKDNEGNIDEIEMVKPIKTNIKKP